MRNADAAIAAGKKTKQKRIHCNCKRANGLIKSKDRQPSLWLQCQAAIERTGKLMAGSAKATEECTVANVCAERRPAQDGPPSPPLLLRPLQALPISADIILQSVCVCGYVEFLG